MAAAAQQPLAGIAWKHLPDAASPELDSLAREHGLHELDIEDCRHARQPAKIVEHGEYSFIVIKTVDFDPEEMELSFHDFDLFLKPDLLLTVAEGPCRIVESALRRLNGDPEFRHPRGIAYALLDQAVDEYQPVLDRVGDIIEGLEDQVLRSPTAGTLQRIFALKRLLIEFRRHTVAMREMVNHVLRAVAGPKDELHPYFRDVYDHLVRALDFAETYRDLLTGSLDIYLTAAANRTNEIVKVLTIYGTIALPLIVVTSFYGMNVHLPWQESRYGWWIPMGITTALTVLTLLWFRKKGWV